MRCGAGKIGGERRGGLGAGFTLIELLVVVSILAILLGVTVPALSGVKESARRAECLTNLKQIGTGLEMYMNMESKGILPEVRPLHDEGGNENDPSLLDLLPEYLSVDPPRREVDGDPTSFWIVADVFKCPSDKTGHDAATNFEPVWRTDGTSYEYSAGLLMVAAELATIRNPAKTITQVYKLPRWSKLPVLADQDDWHSGRGGAVKRNALYFGDWHADWLVQSTEEGDETWEELFQDIFRLGGLPGGLPGGG